MQCGLDFLPLVLDEIHSRRWRTSCVRRWLARARKELAARRKERSVRPPAGASRTYLLNWQSMQECAQREIKTLQAALDLIEAFCRDGRRERLGRVLLLHHAAGQAFGDYCKRRMMILTEPVYLAA